MSADQQSPEQARQALVATLNALEDKVNVPKRVGRAVDKTRVGLRRMRVENPGGLIAVTGSAAAVAGVLAWAIVRSLTRR